MERDAVERSRLRWRWFRIEGTCGGSFSMESSVCRTLARLLCVFSRAGQEPRLSKVKEISGQGTIAAADMSYRIFWPKPERTSSTPRSAVRLCSSRMGLISTTSSETIASESAIISIARWASR